MGECGLFLAVQLGEVGSSIDVRISCRGATGLLVVEDRERLELLAFEQFEARSAAGAQVRDFVGEAHLFDGRCAVAAADDADRGGVGDCLSDRSRAGVERWQLERAHRAVPDDGLGGVHDADVPLDRLWPDVETFKRVRQFAEGEDFRLARIG